MTKKQVNILLDEQTYKDYQKMFPRMVGENVTNFMKTELLKTSTGKAQMEALLQEKMMLKAKAERYEVVCSLLSQIEEKRLKEALEQKKQRAEKAKEEGERYPRCGLCGTEKERDQFVKLEPNLCQQCYRGADRDKIRKFLGLKKSGETEREDDISMGSDTSSGSTSE